MDKMCAHSNSLTPQEVVYVEKKKIDHPFDDRLVSILTKKGLKESHGELRQQEAGLCTGIAIERKRQSPLVGKRSQPKRRCKKTTSYRFMPRLYREHDVGTVMVDDPDNVYEDGLDSSEESEDPEIKDEEEEEEKK